MRYLEEAPQRVILVLSREEAKSLIYDLVGQLAGGGGSQEYLAVCEEDTRKGKRFGFLLANPDKEI